MKVEYNFYLGCDVGFKLLNMECFFFEYMMMSLLYVDYLLKSTIYEDNDSQYLNNTHIILLFMPLKLYTL